MIEKLKFNNLIISNAKVIQKVRIQILRKIIQKMRKLKGLLEKRPGDESTIVKQRKCVAIVEKVKKLKREEIIIRILQLEKCPNKIVTNSHSKPDEVAIAMLAVNKTMQALIERFRQELGYNPEEDENWKKDLIDICKSKAKKQRRKKNAEIKEKKLKKQQNEKPKEKIIKKEILEEDDDEIEKKAKPAKGDSFPVVNIKKGIRNSKNSPATKLKDEILGTLACADDDDGCSESDSEKFKTTEEDTRNNKNRSATKLKDEILETLACADDDDESSESDSAMFKTTEEETRNTKDRPAKKLKDEILETLACADDEDERSESDSAMFKTTEEETRNNKGRPGKKLKDEILETLACADDDDESSESDSKNFKTTKEDYSDFETDDEQLENKEKPIKYLSGFGKIKGLFSKKPKKSDDEPVKVGWVDPFFITETGEPYVANIVLNTKQVEKEEKTNKQSTDSELSSKKFANEKRKNNKFSAERTEETNLHPSWMAKKKYNSIGDFQGKKIKFDDTQSADTVSSFPKTQKDAAPQSDLHPSWAAKQKFKPIITSFQGKKITFTDDE